MKNIIIILLSIMIFTISASGCVPTGTTTIPESTVSSQETMSENTLIPSETMSTSTTSPSETMSEDTMITYQDLTPAEAKELIDNTPDLIIIDVSPNFDEGHIPGSVNYYLGDGSLDEAIPTLDKSKTYLVYCHVDSVSIAGAQKLIDAGFTTVYRLEGNYAAWVAAGYSVEK